MNRTFLHDQIAAVERETKTLTVYSAEPTTDLGEQFETKNVVVKHERLRSVRRNGFLVVRDRHGFRGAIGLAPLREFLTPPVRVPWNPEFDSSRFRDLLSLLDRTLFSSFDRRQMLGTSREIEDRAWRVGRGELHVGFQSLNAFQAQVPVYRRLADETDLAIHIYGESDWQPPQVRNITYHTAGTDEIGMIWFLVYDGGSDDLQKCALVAEERDSNQFYGFWTYDPGSVNELIDYLRRAYG
ncbi:DICT sensory domain-containing protein [Haladaptatus caseinilyticus]|uniref:DICT sensory domain-containing protein n=1 Tax=Haladaptatus caseinilyticus TaxID=2993314 RepID=UPI00224A4BB6|nr:DICT sensory domain-containing protein [Haladaptatus caseinilyticus]